MTRQLPIGVWMECRGRAYTLQVLVSREDYEWAAAQGNWFVTHANGDGRRAKGPGYAVRTARKAEGRGKVLLFLHKEILRRAAGDPPCKRHTIGDHWNGDKLDCRRGNLRWATPQINARNVFGSDFKQGRFDFIVDKAGAPPPM